MTSHRIRTVRHRPERHHLVQGKNLSLPNQTGIRQTPAKDYWP